MKKFLILPLIALGFMALPACTTVEEDHPHVQSTTTTTEETSVHRPVSSTTTETHAVRSY